MIEFTPTAEDWDDLAAWDDDAEDDYEYQRWLDTPRYLRAYYYGEEWG